MNPKDPLQEIDRLLRSRTPDPRPTPGLESRILRALQSPPPPARTRLLPWLIFPPAFAMICLMLWPDPGAPPAPVSIQEPPKVVPPGVLIGTPIYFVADEVNPLVAETRALGRDAERAGRFLIDCLPSLNRVPQEIR